jgi:N-terminal domain of anti-restriction factor ArdC
VIPLRLSGHCPCLPNLTADGLGCCLQNNTYDQKEKTMKTDPERTDVYQRIANQIIEAIERGADKWEMPWHRSSVIPSNAVTGKPYRGINILNLWATAAQQNYRSGL